MAYNPSDHTASNKAYGTRGKPVEARTYFFDKGVTFRYRPYMSLAEVLSNLPTADDRRGNFEVIVNTGGTLQSSGYITGGINQAYWFRDGLADGNLVIKDTDLSDYYTQEEVNALFNELAPVASSGSYNDLTDKPDVPVVSDLNYTQADLVDGGSGNYYLTLPSGISIIESKINNIGYDLNRDNTFTPNRLYGFANNSAQNIVLTVISPL